MPKAKAPAKPAPPQATPSGPDLVDEMIAQFAPKLAKGSWSGMAPGDVPAGKVLLAADVETRAAAFGAVLDRLKDWHREYTALVASRGNRRALDVLDARRGLLVDTLIGLRRPRLTLPDRIAAKVAELWVREKGGFGPHRFYIDGVWDVIRRHAVPQGVGPHLRKAIGRLVRQLRKTGFVNELKHADKFEALLAARR